MHQESSENASSRSHPLSREAFKKHPFDAEATEEVPEKLRGIDLLINPKVYQLSPIDPAVLVELPTEPLVPFRPNWIATASLPKGISLYTLPPEKLWHHGKWLDPMVIWGDEDRKAYDDTRYPWGCVCKIINAAGRIGSGVIIGPRHVLTASHVLDWNSNGAGTVEVHRAGPAVSAISAIAKVWHYKKVPPDPGVSEVDEDYAVIITADRIGDRFGWLGVRTYTSDWDDEPYWRNIGYPTDVGDQKFPAYQRDKKLDEDEWDYGSARAMTTSADVMKGQSGSPMFAFWSDGPYVVAVVSAVGQVYFSGEENWCAGGSYLTRLARHARNSDP